MITVFALLFAAGLGFGLSCWIFGTVLDKSNNIGDSTGGRSDYHTNVHFEYVRDKMSESEAQTFSRNYRVVVTQGDAPSNNSLARRLTSEEVQAYKMKNAEASWNAGGSYNYGTSGISGTTGYSGTSGTAGATGTTGATVPVKDSRATGAFSSANTIYDDEAEFAEWEQKNGGSTTASPFRKLDTRD